MDIQGMILAAGEGRRMHSAKAKALHTLVGKEMLRYVMEAMSFTKGKPLLVVGHGGEQICQAMGEEADYIWQREQRGTGHAVLCAQDKLKTWKGYVLILAGDMPFLRESTLKALCEKVEREGAAAGLLSVEKEDPTGYGRILRNGGGDVTAIVEERDASPEEKIIAEVNVSAYCFALDALLPALASLQKDNAQGEYYLTDCVEIIARSGGRVFALQAEQEEGIGINDMAQLAAGEALMRRRINEGHMARGVRLIDPQQCYIDGTVTIEGGVTIYPGNVIEGNSHIAAGSCLLPGNYIEDAQIGEDNKIGPNAHLRPKTRTGKGCRVGNYVELKNVTLGNGAKVSHLAYCGDGNIGPRSNISCGVIFSNYDGVNKGRTEVGEDVFVGCNSNLVAPIRLGDGAYVAAGSTLTGDVPAEALAVARARQVNKEGWAREKSPKAKAKR